MEAPELHGGGLLHASSTASGHASGTTYQSLVVPDTPTPYTFDPKTFGGMFTDENQLDLARNGLKRGREGLEAKDRSELPCQSGEAQRSAVGPIRHT